MVILEQLRYHQWIKNLFVFIPLFISGNFFDFEFFIKTFFAFGFFCCAAGLVYTINDLADIEKDKQHPEKCTRPLPSGRLSKVGAYLLISVLAIIVFVVQYFYSFATLPFVSFYIVQNLFYSFWLKNVALIDVSLIATGFVLRVLVGVAATGLPFSRWLIIMTFTITILLGLGKRKGEYNLAIEKSKKRRVLEGYSLPLIDSLQVIFTTVTLVVYIMYTFFNEFFTGNRELLFYSSFFVILGLMRYLQLSFSSGIIENPTKIMLKDKFMLIVVLAWVLYLGFITYI